MPTTPRSDVKTTATSASVEEFLSTVTNERRRDDARKIIEIMHRVSGEEPVMWGASMIGFGNYHYRYDSGQEGDSHVMAISPRAAAISVYGLYNASDSDPRFETLGHNKAGQECLYINRFDKVDQKLFETFVREAWARQGSPRD